MRKLLILITILITISLQAGSDHIENFPRVVRSVIETVEKLPEVRELIARVQDEGDVKVRALRKSKIKFGAYWTVSDRSITLVTSYHRSEGALIYYLIFELHNAASQSEFREMHQKARNNKISRKEYILEMEKIEYRNALSTCALLKKGRDQRVFPSTAQWNIAPTFKEHYRIQYAGGHAQHHGHNYDRLKR